MNYITTIGGNVTRIGGNGLKFITRTGGNLPVVVVMARGKFKSLSVSETVYIKLREIAERRGFSTLADTVAYLVSLEELVVRRLESITSNTGNITSSSGNITTSTGNPPVQTTTQSKAKVEEKRYISGGYEWCRSKAKIRNLQSFLKWVDDSFGLIDWWEEDDRVCFETRRKPAKID